MQTGTEIAVAPPLRKLRIFEIDVLRGIAVVMMSSFHLVFDLLMYYNQPININSGFWFWVGRLSAILFMIVSGISSGFSGVKLRRVGMVFVAAIIVTVVSIFTMGENYIRFGILHFFAAAMLLHWAMEKIVKSKKIQFIITIVFIPLSFWLGNIFAKIVLDTPLLIPFGIQNPTFTSFDYYPVFPWLAYFCIGCVFSAILYKDKRPLLPFLASNGDVSKVVVPLRPFAFLGRHSLIIYLVHQPLLLVVLAGLNILGIFG